MVSPSMSMSLSNEFSNYSFSPTVMPLPWMPHSLNPSQAPFKIFTPQISPYIPPRLPSDFIGNTVNQQVRRKSVSKKTSGKPSYKHVPHKDKPPHLVARRNARERRRVQAVNSAFARLRKCVPIENRNKRLSKVKTLHRAIEYIKGLQSMLSDTSDGVASDPVHYGRQRYESMTSPDDDDDEFDEEEIKEERGDSEFADFEYMESDVENVNKENKNWTSISEGCDSNYWSYGMPYSENYSASLQS